MILKPYHVPEKERPMPLIEYRGQTYILEKAMAASSKYQDAGIRDAQRMADRALHMAFAAVVISAITFILTALR